jgi:predicted acetyltransferase
MSTVEIAEVRSDEMGRFVEIAHRFWGGAPEPAMELVSKVLDRAMLARTDGEDIGAAAVIDFRLSLPGGQSVAMDGVTWVGASATARRRGALRAMMTHCLESARERGVGLLGLGASESSIYRRFGYGVATHICSAEIVTAHAALRAPFRDPGRLRFQSLDTSIATLRDVESRQPHRVAGIGRSEAHWRRIAVADAKPLLETGPAQLVVHVGGAGDVDGFVIYRFEERWTDHLADGVVHVKELTALNLDAHLALWQHVLTMDLAEHLRMERFWLDDPIQHLLADPRRLRTATRDDLHLRVVDVAAMLQARRYSCDGSVVIELSDPACPDIAGRYRLDGGRDDAAVSRTAEPAGLRLDGASLASVFLGDTSVAALHRAGLVEELRRGAVASATAMFTWSPRPWLNHMF